MSRTPTLPQVTSLVARALAVSPEALSAGFRAATMADFPQVLELRKSVLGSQITWDDARYLSWRYHFGSASSGRGECWVATRGDTVLGVLGSERIAVQHDDFTVDALSVMDFAVRPDIESLGLGPWMAMTLCRMVPCTIAIGSNPKSRAIVTRVLSRLPDRRSYSYYTTLDRRLQIRLRSRWAAATVALLAQTAMKTWRVFSLPAGSHMVTVRRMDHFDSSVDSLIARAHNRAEISIGRSQAFLNWRLFDNPRASYIVCGAYHGDVLVGYVAVRIVPITGGGHDLVIEDWLVDPQNEGQIAFRVLLGAMIDIAVKERCENVVAIACHEPSERVMRRVGFMAQINPYETLSAYSGDARLTQAINAEVPWHVSGAHTDRDV